MGLPCEMEKGRVAQTRPDWHIFWPIPDSSCDGFKVCAAAEMGWVLFANRVHSFMDKS